MAMSSHDYQVIALELNRALRLSTNKNAKTTVLKLIEEFSFALQQYNPRFKPEVFRSACLGEPR